MNYQDKSDGCSCDHHLGQEINSTAIIWWTVGIFIAYTHHYHDNKEYNISYADVVMHVYIMMLMMHIQLYVNTYLLIDYTVVKMSYNVI